MRLLLMSITIISILAFASRAYAGENYGSKGYTAEYYSPTEFKILSGYEDSGTTLYTRHSRGY